MVHFFKKFKYLDFCIPELESLATMFGVDLKTLYVTPKQSIDVMTSPLVYVNLPGDSVAKQIQGRSVLIQEILQVFSQSNQSF